MPGDSSDQDGLTMLASSVAVDALATLGPACAKAGAVEPSAMAAVVTHNRARRSEDERTADFIIYPLEDYGRIRTNPINERLM